MKAVIYARFSCSKQREASIEDQLRVCREWCDREGYEVVDVYCDHAMSGRTDERPEFRRMIANAGESDIVLVYMMDRFSRDAYDAPIYKKKLKDKGVRVVSATEAIPDTVEAVLIEKLYEGLAVIESAHIAERTKRGMHGNALKCMHNGVCVFGYSFGEDGRYVINEDEAPIVREVFARRASGESPNHIARDLARRGIETTTHRPVSHTFVANMLKNEKYRGVYSWGDVRIEGGMPRIVTDGEFFAAKNVRSRKVRKDEQWDEFILSGRAICGGCGRNLVGVSGRNRSGVKYNYYRCSQRCGVKPIRTSELEGQIAARLRGMLSDRDNVLEVGRLLEAFVNDCESNLAALAAARKRHDDAQKAMSNLLRAVSQGLDYSDVKDEIERLKRVSAAALAETITYESAPSFDAEDFADLLQTSTELDDTSLVDAMVSQVLVTDDEIIVTLAYNNEKCEPVRFNLERVRTNEVWLPNRDDTRTKIGYFDGCVIVSFPRAA